MPGMEFKLGDRGPAVAEIKARLARLGLLPGSAHVRTGDPLISLLREEGHDPGADLDPAEWETTALISAEFDEDLQRAVCTFQERFGITVDGIVGTETFMRLEEARWRLGDRVLSYHPGRAMAGEDVAELQRRLGRMGFDAGQEDGRFGMKTYQAVREFQREVGVPVDGAAGPVTLRALGRLHRTVGNESAHSARERYGLESLRTGVAGKTVVLDPGHGETDSGDVVDTVRESDVTGTLASLIEGSLAALGTRVMLTRSAHLGHGDVAMALDDDQQRAEFCNEADADLVISLHTSHAQQPEAQFVVHYFGRTDGGTSEAGRVAAEIVCEGMSGNAVCATGPRTWDILRLTKMPAIRIDLGKLSDPEVRRNLSDDAYLRGLARSIASGVSEFFAPAPVEDSAALSG